MPDPVKIRQINLTVELEDGAVHEVLLLRPTGLSVNIGGEPVYEDLGDPRAALALIAVPPHEGRTDFTLKAKWGEDTEAAYIDHTVSSKANPTNLGGQADGIRKA